ncbi:uncharacterized protein METZ01_LOCUS315244, partial [marine metagenome]
MTKVASVISLALHPMVIAPLTFGTLIYTGSSNNGNLNSIFCIAFFFSTILSLFTVIY